MLGLPRLRHLSARLRRLPSGKGQDTLQVLSSIPEDRKNIKLETIVGQSELGRDMEQEASQEIKGVFQEKLVDKSDAIGLNS